MTILAMTLLARRREVAEIARFATTLTPPQRQRLGLPRKRGTRAFRKVPGYGVFYQRLTRMDPEAFAAHLSRWLQSRAGTLPQALALDGKMIRQAIGLLPLAQHAADVPQALAVYDRRKVPPAANRRPPPPCAQGSPPSAATSSPPIRSTARVPWPAPASRRAATISSKSRPTRRISATWPAAGTRWPTPPFLPIRKRPRARRGPLAPPFPFEPLIADFPCARTLIVLRRQCTVKSTGLTITEARFYLSSAPPDQYTPVHWLQLIRGH